MECPFYQHISPYLDGELDSHVAREIGEHIKTCDFCQREMDLMLQIRRSLKQGADTTKASPFLREKILNDSRRLRRIILVPGWRFARAAILIGMAVLTVTLASDHWHRGKGSFMDLAGQLVKRHALYATGEKPLTLQSSDSQYAESWLESQLGRRILIPRAAFAGYELKGVDVFKENDRQFAYMIYQRDRKTIGYLIFEGLGIPVDLPEVLSVGGTDLHLGRKNGTNLAVWKKTGLIYVILTTEDRPELLEYARACIQFFSLHIGDNDK